MTTLQAYTAEQFVNAPAFMAVAIEDAIALVAKTNGQTIELTTKAFELEVPAVVGKVAKLVAFAAQHCAKEASAGRMF